MPASPAKLDAILQLQAQLARTGRIYRIDLDALDLDSLRGFQRLLRDMEDEQRTAIRRARIMPWQSR